MWAPSWGVTAGMHATSWPLGRDQPTVQLQSISAPLWASVLAKWKGGMIIMCKRDLRSLLFVCLSLDGR